MNTSFLTAILLASLPAAASAVSHSVAVRVQKGGKSYSKTVNVAAGSQVNFVGPVGDRNMIFNAVLAPKGDALSLDYQFELSKRGDTHTFQAQGSVILRPGDALMAVECGEWKLDLALDGKSTGGWRPAGPNYRLTVFSALATKRTCRVTQGPGTQSNIVESSITGGPAKYFILNSMLERPEGNASKLQYQIEDSPVQTHGDVTLVLGKKAAARGGKIEFLLEGASAAKAAAAPAVAAPQPAEGGAVRMLR